MTNSEKFLKDGVDIKEIANGINEAYFDSYDEEDLVDCVYRWFETKTKPTLTEDERVILRNIRGYDIIKRKDNVLYLQQLTDIYVAGYFRGYDHLFQFIKDGEEYSIEELLNE